LKRRDVYYCALYTLTAVLVLKPFSKPCYYMADANDPINKQTSDPSPKGVDSPAPRETGQLDLPPSGVVEVADQPSVEMGESSQVVAPVAQRSDPVKTVEAPSRDASASDSENLDTLLSFRARNPDPNLCGDTSILVHQMEDMQTEMAQDEGTPDSSKN